MQHVTSFTMFDSYHVGLFTTQTRDFEKIQDGPQCLKRCMALTVKLTRQQRRVDTVKPKNLESPKTAARE